MNIRTCAALLTLCWLGMSPASAADHGKHASATAQQASGLQASAAAAPRLILAAPLPDFLKKGYVYLPFRVENMTILPLYAEIHGAEAVKLTPKIGHLHVMVDDNAWSWIHASTDPIYFSSLPPGTHQVKVELADAAHNVLEVQTVKLVVP